MLKYDFELDLSQNSSTGIILNKINKGSTVLEFGCATGRMTRYMKDILECQVYIVEYDASAFEIAQKYAEGGLCDDILNFRWIDKFRDIEFDAIIFADVLEHLITPERVLKEASKLLKDTGCIYVTVPNITHNDILLKAYEERFDYTRTGLLDDTHVHFWGLKNLETLSGKCGLYIRDIQGTYCPTGLTEQFAENNNIQNILFTNILKERKCGEVYQFVVTFDKNMRENVRSVFKTPAIKSLIYLDTGKGFNPDEVITFDSEYSGRGSYIAHYVIEDVKKVERVRFDPIELQGCILMQISILQENEKLHLNYQNVVEMDQGLLMLGTDPMICADVLIKDAPIEIEAEIVILGERYIEIIQDVYVHKCAEYENSVACEKQELQERLTELTSHQKELQERVNVLTSENGELYRNLGAYITLANNKDKYALTLEQDLAYYKNLAVVKLHIYIIHFFKATKRHLKRIFRKEGY